MAVFKYFFILPDSSIFSQIRNLESDSSVLDFRFFHFAGTRNRSVHPDDFSYSEFLSCIRNAEIFHLSGTNGFLNLIRPERRNLQCSHDPIQHSPAPPPPANPHPRRNSGIQIPEAYREFIISLRVWHPSSPDYMLNPDHPDTTGIYNPHIRNTSIRNRRFRTMRIETVSKSNNSNNNNNQKRIIQLKL